MVRLGVEEDSRVRVEAPDVSDAPELRAEQVWLCDAEEDQQRNGTGQLEGHDPEHRGSLAPCPLKGLITPVLLRIPSRHSVCHRVWVWILPLAPTAYSDLSSLSFVWAVVFGIAATAALVGSGSLLVSMLTGSCPKRHFTSDCVDSSYSDVYTSTKGDEVGRK